MENGIVEEQIEKNKVKVIISGDSDKGLTAENGKISGLDPNKYYKVEELDGSGNPVETYFVKADGKLGSLGNIGKVKGREITGLKNDVTYRVKSAALFPNGSLKYFDFNDTTPLNSASITSGKVTIEENRPNCYFELPTTIDVTKYYEVMKVKISGTEIPWDEERTSVYRKGNNPSFISPFIPPLSDAISQPDYGYFNKNLKIGIFEFDSDTTRGYTGTISPSFLKDMSIAKLPDGDTVNDYIFVEYYAPLSAAPNDVISRDFYVLTVNVKIPRGNTNIVINPPPILQDGAPTLTYNGGIPITEGETKNISLTNGTAAEKTITATNSTGNYNWYYNNNTTAISTSNSIVIGTSPYLNAVGTYIITVERSEVINEVYSTWFILKIIP
jgi:hypothetical protein